MKPLYTTKEESEELLALGMDPETADMCYLSQTDGNDGKPSYFRRPAVKGDDTEQYYSSSLPCWSFGALVKFLPVSGPDSVYKIQLMGQLSNFDVDIMGECLVYVKRFLSKQKIKVEMKVKLVGVIHKIVASLPDFNPDYRAIAEDGADEIIDIVKHYIEL